MRNNSFLVLILSALFFAAHASPSTAAEYQRPPFELKGELSVDVKTYGKDVFPLDKSYFIGAWQEMKIKVYKNYFTGYYRWTHPARNNETALLTVNGTYDRGYLAGSWDYQKIAPWEDDNHGPYPQAFEGSGTFVSGLIESKTTAKIPAIVSGSLDFSHGELAKESTPASPKWEKVEEQTTFDFKWNGELAGDVCGGPELDQYVGKKIEVGKIVKDYSRQAEIMHCGLADGSAPVAWQRVKDEEAIYVSDLLKYHANGVTIVETYQPEQLQHRGTGELDYFTGDYVLGGSNIEQNPGPGIVSFLYPPPRESKLGVVAGVFWGNIKSLWNNGTLVLHNSQAVAGIKGTNFMFGSNDLGATELWVLEGAVEFTAKADGKKVMVTAGQKAIATDSGLGEVATFDPAPFLAKHKNIMENPKAPVEEDYSAGPAPKGAPANDPIEKTDTARDERKAGAGYSLPAIITLAIVIGGAWVVMKRKKGGIK